jgi:hypothetical protein
MMYTVPVLRIRIWYPVIPCQMDPGWIFPRSRIPDPAPFLVKFYLQNPCYFIFMKLGYSSNLRYGTGTLETVSSKKIVCLLLLDPFYIGSRNQDPSPGWINSRIRIREKISRIRNTAPFWARTRYLHLKLIQYMIPYLTQLGTVPGHDKVELLHPYVRRDTMLLVAMTTIRICYIRLLFNYIHMLIIDIRYKIN